jgi:hypothetical protein
MDMNGWSAAARSAAEQRFREREQAAIDAGHPEWVEFPMTRDAALKAKVTKFFTGWPCKKGHVAPCYARGGICTKCDAESQRKWQQGKGREAYNAYMREYMRRRRANGQ